VNRTVFLDRDGVINEKAPDDDYVTSWAGFRFLPGALDAVRSLTDAGFTIVVVSNQRGVARGRMTAAAVDDVNSRMRAAVEASGGRIDAIYVCPHDIGACECRKPDAGLFRQAARDLPGVELEGSITIGDSLSDVEAASRIGSRAYVVGEGERLERLLDAARARGLPVAGSAPTLLEVVTGSIVRPEVGVS
jgi:histidinol-phosphate phosphatase family protein